MDNIFDYLDWRGDIPFSVSPFNEVDNYIVAKIGCCDFNGIVSGGTEPVAVGAALDAYFSLRGGDGVSFGALASPALAPLLRRLPETPRFRDLMLRCFVRRALPAMTEQFSALTVSIPDGTHYVSFRGTDDTLYAWKEDCMMALSGAIPAQRDAADYLMRTAAVLDGVLRVGGHSKGGNLAVYAAAQADAAVQDRIGIVYNNDGPGFAAEFLSSPGYLRIREKLLTLLPQYSIVGTLLEQETNCTVVRSSRFGVAAHDGFNWMNVNEGSIAKGLAARLSVSCLIAAGGIVTFALTGNFKAFSAAIIIQLIYYILHFRFRLSVDISREF